MYSGGGVHKRQLSEALKQLMEVIREALKQLMEVISEALKQLMEVISEAPKQLGRWLGRHLSSLWR